MTEWRSIPASIVDFEANPISKRAGAAVRKLASPRRASKIKNGTVVLRLKMDHRGFFDVQQVVQGDTHAPPSP
jgi:hypothetical protein